MKEQKRRSRGLTIILLLLALLLLAAVVWGVGSALQKLLAYSQDTQIGTQQSEEEVPGQSVHHPGRSGGAAPQPL